MEAPKKDYLDLDETISLILAIIPITSWVLGVLTRVLEKNYLAAIVRAFFGFNIIWILDIVSMIRHKKILRVL